MNEYNFTIVLELESIEENGERHLESLLDGGCNDATIAIGRRGYIHLDFGREAPSALEAISSAMSDAQVAVPGSKIAAVGPDLVNLTDLSELVGCTRQNIRRYVSGEAKVVDRCPPPATNGEPALWRLVEVLPWLVNNTTLRPSDPFLQEVAQATFSHNQSLQEDRIFRASRKMGEQTAMVTLNNRIGNRLRFNNPQSVNIWKVAETVTRLSKNGVPKTKLNKLMFYADFVHHKTYGVGITNLAYVRLPLGPVPDEYRVIFSALEEAALVVSSEEMRGPYTAEIIKQTDESFVGHLTAEEISSIDLVLRHFEAVDVATIVKISHLEPGWLETVPGGIISYDFAERLLGIS